MDKKNNAILFRIKMRIKLRERSEKKKLIEPLTKPRYDAIFHRGLDWLNRQ